MKNHINIIMIGVLLIITPLFNSCLKEDDETIIVEGSLLENNNNNDDNKPSHDIYSHVPKETMDGLKQYMPIYEGTTPPNVEGMYLIDTMYFVYCQDNAYKPGTTIQKMYIQLNNQNNETGTIDFYAKQSNETSVGKGALISGEGNNFTIYFDVNTEIVSQKGAGIIKATEVVIISGTITSQGIKDITYTLTTVKKENDIYKERMDVGVYRVASDKDKMSYYTDFPIITYSLSKKDSYYYVGEALTLTVNSSKDCDIKVSVRTYYSSLAIDKKQNNTSKYSMLLPTTHVDYFHIVITGTLNTISVVDSFDYQVNDRVLDPVSSDLYVDLNLPSGTLWSSSNVGAESPEGYGILYSWGELKPKTIYSGLYNGKYYYKWLQEDGYIRYSSSDNRTQLLTIDDAATYNMGDDWRMPTVEECQELVEYCDWNWCSDYNGSNVSGAIVSSKTNPNNYIFLPSLGDNGDYWSSTLLSDRVSSAYSLSFDNKQMSVYDFERTFGLFVRAVRN
ncbi:MAG: DUF1566 domain-containing protein [Bacteroidales bacterium]|nr:DUF1566 domain-containing protein [Bacteroidales bacterium]